jgi:hypothetical protein
MSSGHPDCRVERSVTAGVMPLARAADVRARDVIVATAAHEIHCPVEA